MISSCDALSKRLEYIEEMKKFISVDVYGKCGDFDCKDFQCNKKLLAKKYKFYLAFENSLCNQYVTEKFMDVVYGQDIVAVVMGGGGYENFAPKSAYIDYRDYETPGHLAKYLKYLDNNSTAYNEYFNWKKWIEKVVEVPFQGYLCETCVMLNLERLTGLTNGYSAIKNPEKFIGVEKNCKAVKVEWWKKFEVFEAKKPDIEMHNIESFWE